MGHNYRMEVEISGASKRLLKKASAILDRLGGWNFEDCEDMLVCDISFNLEDEAEFAKKVIRALRTIPGLEIERDDGGLMSNDAPLIRVGFQDLEIPVNWYSDTDPDDGFTEVLDMEDGDGGA